VAYGSFFVFGLLYFGGDAAVLLLPMLMIQVLWMTYAVYGIGHWLTRSKRLHAPRWLTPAAYALLPAFLALQNTGVISLH
jgi:hypothetical protein